MRLRNSFLAAGLFAIFFVGCASRREAVEVLRAIPDYSNTNIVYDVSAKCYVHYGMLKSAEDRLRTELSACGYTVCSNSEFRQAHPLRPDFIIEVLRWGCSIEKYHDETVLFVQVITRVRRPAVLSEDKTVAVFGEKPRDFQSISRQIIGKRAPRADDRQRGIEEAMSNLMYNPRFRESLQSLQNQTNGSYGYLIRDVVPKKDMQKQDK